MRTADHAGEPRAVRRTWLRRVLVLATGVLLCYLVVAYVVLPWWWRRLEHREPGLAGGPRVSRTANGIPGDPVNLALLGSETNLVAAMMASRWFPADPITLRSSLRIAVDSVFSRPDDVAPVSDLFLFGRKQDLAFELPVGDNPRHRHHVRFWRWDQREKGHEVWFGAATFDERVGLSHTTGQITHHIGPDIDAERDLLLNDLRSAGRTKDVYFIDGFHQQLQGRNGGGDAWHTDGRLGVALLLESSPARAAQ